MYAARPAARDTTDVLLCGAPGRTHNLAYDSRDLPGEVNSYAMIPRVVDKYGRHAEELARAADEAGHRETATDGIPVEGTTIEGSFHMEPGRPNAPAVLYVPGMDQTREGAGPNSPTVARKRHWFES